MRKWLTIGTAVFATAMLSGCGSLGAGPQPDPQPSSSQAPSSAPESSAPSADSSSAAPGSSSSAPGVPGMKAAKVTASFNGKALALPEGELNCVSGEGKFIISPKNPAAESSFSLMIDANAKKVSTLAATVDGTPLVYAESTGGTTLSATQNGEAWKVSGQIKDLTNQKDVKVEIEASCV